MEDTLSDKPSEQPAASGVVADSSCSALDFLCSIPHVPMMIHGNLPRKASNSERRRWLQNKSVLINGEKPKPSDAVTFPIEQLIFFPKSRKRRCTMRDYTDERSFFRQND